MHLLRRTLRNSNCRSVWLWLCRALLLVAPAMGTIDSAMADLVPLPAFGVRLARGFRISLYAGPELANDIYAMTLDASGNVIVTSQGYVKKLVDTDGDGLPDAATLFAVT